MPFLMALLAGCVNTSNDAAIYAALDYRIDRPRILGIRVTPPALIQGTTVALDALFVAPDGARSDRASWSTCGLSNDAPTTVRTLECFSDGADVSLLADGALPAPYLPPNRYSSECPEDSGEGTRGCVHDLPLLVESDFMAGDTAAEGLTRGASQAQWYLEPWPLDRVIPLSAESLPRSLALEGEVAPGAEVQLLYVVQADLRAATFRWFVDDGTLLETGETVLHDWQKPSGPGEKGVSTTSNRWVLPEEPGVYRLFVVFEGSGWAESSFYASAPDQVWDSLEVEIP